jgi:hypothetical protein
VYLRGVAYAKLAIDAFAREFITELGPSFIEKILRVGQTFKFKLNDKVHTLRVDKIENGKVFFTIDSRSYELGEDQKITWKIDGENMDTLEVRVISVNENLQEAKFKLRAKRKIEVGEVEETEIVFRFDTGGKEHDFYYKFTEANGWMWSDDSKFWIPVSINTDEDINDYSTEVYEALRLYSGPAGPFIGPGVVVKEHKLPGDLSREVIRALDNKDYSQGLRFLVAITLEQEAASVDFDHPELLTDKVEMNYEGLFVLKTGTRYMSILLKFEDGSWKWAVAGAYAVSNWKRVSEASDFGDPFDKVIRNLRGKSLYDGAEIIFEINLAEFYEAFETRERVEDEEAWSRIDEEERQEVLDIEEDLDRELRCEDCGKDSGFFGWTSLQNICTEEECKAIAAKTGRNCIFEEVKGFFGALIPGGSCKEKEIVKEGISCRNIVSGEPLSVEFSSCISADEINRILDKKNSPARGTGNLFVRLGKEYGIDPVIALAFFRQESQFGTEGIAVHTKSMGNIKYSSKCPGGNYRGFCQYDSWEDSIEDWYRLVSGPVYVRSGLDTIEEIIPKYAPSSENDVNVYIDSVRSFVENPR